MDLELVFSLKTYLEEFRRFTLRIQTVTEGVNRIYYIRVIRVMHLLLPIATALLVYNYLKYLLLYNAYRYEKYMRRRYGHMKKVTRQLRHLTKRCGNLYFCYMPMNHGTILPQPYLLFTAIKEVLTNTNKPATRVLRTNLLQNLLQADQCDPADGTGETTNFPDNDSFVASLDDIDVSDFNLNIMKCCREMIIQGVKDFDVMSTVYRVMDTVAEDAD